MAEDKKTLLSLVNASGFLFQLRIEREVRQLSHQHDSNWNVVASEHRWVDPIASSEGFIDLILQSHAGRMVVECKRVRQGEWIFLVGDGKTNISRSRFLWTYLNDSQTPFSQWDEFNFADSSPESSFCVVRGQGESDRPMLERVTGPLLRSTEVFAEQELGFGYDRTYGPAWIYIPVIITNAQLRICKFDPQEINIGTGELPDADFEAVPMVRFRKALSTTMSAKITDQTIERVTIDQQRTVLVVNSESLNSVLRTAALHKFEEEWPWEHEFQ